MGDILVVAEHLNGALDESTFELIGMANDLGNSVVAFIGGSDDMVGQLGAASKVVRVDAGADFNPETYGAALVAVADHVNPQVVLTSGSSMGMELANMLSAQKSWPLAVAATKVSIDGDVKAESALFGGKIIATTNLGSGPCVVAVVAGSAPADAGRKDGRPAVESVDMPATAGKVTFKKLIMPESADVDITTKDVLVAIGRGIGSKDDIEVAEELAEALDAAVAASRPIIDAGWLPKSRQVGKSGLKVKPKLYIALGISGAPEHLEGMKNSSTIIAINSDKNAPIFDVAHYGMVADLFDVVEELTEALD